MANIQNVVISSEKKLHFQIYYIQNQVISIYCIVIALFNFNLI